MPDEWPDRAARYLRRRGFTEVSVTSDGCITGLPGVRAVTMDLMDMEYVEYADMELIMSAMARAMPYAVVQERPGYPASAGYVTLSVGGFARLLGAPDDGEATPQELTAVFASAVAAVTNYDMGMVMPLRELVAGVDPVGVVAALAALYCAIARAILPADAHATLLQHLGIAAATGGAA